MTRITEAIVTGPLMPRWSWTGVRPPSVGFTMEVQQDANGWRMGISMQVHPTLTVSWVHPGSWDSLDDMMARVARTISELTGGERRALARLCSEELARLGCAADPAVTTALFKLAERQRLWTPPTAAKGYAKYHCRGCGLKVFAFGLSERPVHGFCVTCALLIRTLP